MNTRARWLQAGFGCFAFAMASAAFAQAYPSRPIRIVVPLAPGGPADVAARVVGEKLSEELKQTITIDNRSGGNATIGTDIVAHAPADGYTLLIATPAYTSNPSLLKSATYDPVKDFTAVSNLMLQPLFVVTPSSVAANNMKELIVWLKANPGKFNYGTSGTGGPQHLMGEMFKAATGTQITHVPYRGAAPAAVALLSGETQISFSTPTNVISFVKTGKLKAFSVSTAKRSHFDRTVPTMQESGYANFDYSSWTGLVAPAGTPKDVIERLHQVIVQALKAKDVQDRFALQGMDPFIDASAADFDKFLSEDVARSSKIIKATGIQPE